LLASTDDLAESTRRLMPLFWMKSFWNEPSLASMRLSMSMSTLSFRISLSFSSSATLT
jgi:hypothetical protein